MSGFDVLRREAMLGFNHARGVLRAGAGVAALLLVAAPLSAQDLDPRSHALVPINGTFLVTGFALSHGGVVTDPTLPVTDVSATVETPPLGLAHSFSLFGKTAQAFAGLPYSWAQASEVQRTHRGDVRVPGWEAALDQTRCEQGSYHQVGANFTTVSIGWQTGWIPQPKPAPSR